MRSRPDFGKAPKVVDVQSPPTQNSPINANSAVGNEDVVLEYVECPRDSWQGLRQMIPTKQKVSHLLSLLESGFRSLDLGSFVSTSAVPQMSDTEEVLNELPAPEGRRYLCIIANERGLERGLKAKQLTDVGYPLSISETFEQRNTKRSLHEAWQTLERLLELSPKHLGFVVYVSMAFGNPYGDPWSAAQVLETVQRLREHGVKRIALADTYGVASPSLVSSLSRAVVAALGSAHLGVHLHARAEHTLEMARAALDAGIMWFEGALGGVGGCPFAGDALVGNLPTETLVPELERHGLSTGIDQTRLNTLALKALQLKNEYE